MSLPEKGDGGLVEVAEDADTVRDAAEMELLRRLFADVISAARRSSTCEAGAVKTTVEWRSSSSAWSGGASSERTWRRNCSWSFTSWDAAKRDVNSATASAATSRTLRRTGTISRGSQTAGTAARCASASAVGTAGREPRRCSRG